MTVLSEESEAVVTQFTRVQVGAAVGALLLVASMVWTVSRAESAVRFEISEVRSDFKEHASAVVTELKNVTKQLDGLNHLRQHVAENSEGLRALRRDVDELRQKVLKK